MLRPTHYIAWPSARADTLALMMVACSDHILTPVTSQMRRKPRCVLVTGASRLNRPKWVHLNIPLPHPLLQHAIAGGRTHQQRAVLQVGHQGSKERLTWMSSDQHQW